MQFFLPRRKLHHVVPFFIIWVRMWQVSLKQKENYIFRENCHQEQGFSGKTVQHVDKKTATGDWRNEYGPKVAPKEPIIIGVAVRND